MQKNIPSFTLQIYEFREWEDGPMNLGVDFATKKVGKKPWTISPLKALEIHVKNLRRRKTSGPYLAHDSWRNISSWLEFEFSIKPLIHLYIGWNDGEMGPL